MKKNKKVLHLTMEEILEAESHLYTIKVGSDFYCYEGHFSFTKRAASRHFNTIVKELTLLFTNGDKKQKEHAARCFEGLQIENLRIH